MSTSIKQNSLWVSVYFIIPIREHWRILSRLKTQHVANSYYWKCDRLLHFCSDRKIRFIIKVESHSLIGRINYCTDMPKTMQSRIFSRDFSLRYSLFPDHGLSTIPRQLTYLKSVKQRSKNTFLKESTKKLKNEGKTPSINQLHLWTLCQNGHHGKFNQNNSSSATIWTIGSNWILTEF